jgi:hypothetical protein
MAGISKVRWRWLLGTVVLLCAGGVVLACYLILFAQPRDLVFRGKLESEWIKGLKYWDQEQVKEWQGYGEEGVQVLIRGLRNAARPGERAYRKVSRHLPGLLREWLPAPKDDTTRPTRMCVVALLGGLGKDAESAVPVMIEVVRNDEADSVRQSAISYFNSSEDEHCLLNRLTPKQKKGLLGPLIRDAQDKDNWGLRNNAVISLGFYPEQRDKVAPVLVQALKDTHPEVQLCAAESLYKVAPEVARNSGVTAILCTIAKNPDDQVANRAIRALGRAGNQLEIALPTLIQSLESTNRLIASSAVRALEWGEFHAYSEICIPALKRAAERKDNVADYAKGALRKWSAEDAKKEGVKAAGSGK